MTRTEMLEKLRAVKFELIDPPSEWKDIGFTEREIWVNSKGYGYIACDEPTWYWEGPGISKEKWAEIREKIENDELFLDDIRGTSLYDLLDDYNYPIKDDNFDFDYPLPDLLSNILNLPENTLPELYCMDTIEGLQFFDSKEKFTQAYERDWCDYKWDDLEDEMLAKWITRLSQL